MKYKFTLEYSSTTTSEDTSSRVCNPIYGDELATTLTMENGEWFRKRKLEGRLTFVRDDYQWIMSRDFDGSFKLTILCSTDDANWHEYFSGSFSRANLEIDEDDKKAVLNSLAEENEYNVIDNNKDEQYDLMKIIPESEMKEVRSRVFPAMALVDLGTTPVKTSDIFCNAPMVAAGFRSENQITEWDNAFKVSSNPISSLVGIYAEAKIEMKDGYTDGDGTYLGQLAYSTSIDPIDSDVVYTSLVGVLFQQGSNNYLTITFDGRGGGIVLNGQLFHNSTEPVWALDMNDSTVFSPQSILLEEVAAFNYHRISIYLHYITASLLTNSGSLFPNIIDTADYYKRMSAFNNADNGLQLFISSRTVEQPNGHRLIDGTGEQGTTPQYFAPPDDSSDYIPLSEDNWHYCSLWYTITPSVSNGLLDPNKAGIVSWSTCWTLGTILNRLLQKITDNKVSFSETTEGSQFLYSTINPVSLDENFTYLFTQKSNVMRPSTKGESSARCPVTLDWFLSFLRNALNCFWWLEARNGGTYAFRIEHVEYFRRGGRYSGSNTGLIDLTQIKPLRNFLRNNAAAKHLDDCQHKYSYDTTGMTEKYTFSWQGDGGSDTFKGHPMFFRAGWIEKGSSESHEVNNIFADLSWLMLTSGSDTASSKNYEGVFAFAGYRPIAASNIENQAPASNALLLAENSRLIYVAVDVWITAPQGTTITLQRHWYIPQQGTQTIATYTATGQKQVVTVEFESAFIVPNSIALIFSNYQQVVIHRIHARTGNVFNVPNTENLLDDGLILNGPLSWPWLQNQYLHYDIPARRWSFDSDDIDTATFSDNGTVKMFKNNP